MPAASGPAGAYELLARAGGALRIGTNVWIGSEPLYLARELGRLDPAVVELVEYPSASEVLRAYRNQAIDGMVISLDELFGLAADGFQPRIVLVVDVSHGADVVVGRRGMRTMKDLKGKSIAVESSALGAFVLSRALALNGMQASDVKVVHLESNEQPGAFEKGEVDAAVTFDPYRAQFLRAGGKTLFDSTQIPGEIVDLLAVRASVIARPNAVRALLAGWFGALDYMKSDSKDAARRMGIRHRRRASSSSRRWAVCTSRRATRTCGCWAARPELAVTGRRLMALMVSEALQVRRRDRERSGARDRSRRWRSEPMVEPSHSGDAQAHGAAHPPGLRRDVERGQPALPRSGSGACGRG